MDLSVTHSSREQTDALLNQLDELGIERRYHHDVVFLACLEDFVCRRFSCEKGFL